MPEDEKTAGPESCRDPQPAQDGGKRKRKRAPDQDVLPGILGKQLRAAYGELLNAPIPDTFNELIKRLESQERGERAGGLKEPRREESDQ